MKVGYLSYRIAGTDGVSLEARRWQEVLEQMGHEVIAIGGEIRGGGIEVPWLHFMHPEAENLHRRLIYLQKNWKELEAEVYAQVESVYRQLAESLAAVKLDKLIVANVMSLPIHLSACLAVNKYIYENKLDTICRNHDFWWERPRYARGDLQEFLGRYFVPADNPFLRHVTINTLTRDEFFRRQGKESLVIHDCFNFDDGLDERDEYNSSWRQDLGIGVGDIVFLQATRIVPRKRIELAIELVAKLGDPRIVLVLAGYEGDEAGGYLQRLRDVSRSFGVRMIYAGDRVNGERRMSAGRKVYTLWDCFVNADWMTYPSDFEGFGNQFIEGVYFRKPIFVNRYEIYKADIEPKGFEAVAIDGKIEDRHIDKVRDWLANPNKAIEVTNKNFELGRQHFSYKMVERQLQKLGF